MKKLDKFFVNPDIKKADTLPSSFYKNDQQFDEPSQSTIEINAEEIK